MRTYSFLLPLLLCIPQLFFLLLYSKQFSFLSLFLLVIILLFIHLKVLTFKLLTQRFLLWYALLIPFYMSFMLSLIDCLNNNNCFLLTVNTIIVYCSFIICRHLFFTCILGLYYPEIRPGLFL